MNIINKIKDCFRFIMQHKPIEQSKISCENPNSSTNKLHALLFSDFHGTVVHETLKRVLLNQPYPDVVFALGDISVSDLTFIKNTFPYLPIYGVCGNHDELTTLDMVDIPNIHCKVVEVAGVRFAGMGGSVRYKHGSYVMYSQTESIDIAKSLPPAEILISHDKAFSGKTTIRFPEFAKDTHEGMAGISCYLRKHSPFLHIHGHIHQNKQYVFKSTNTVSVYGVASITIENGSLVDYRVLLDI